MWLLLLLDEFEDAVDADDEDDDDEVDDDDEDDDEFEFGVKHPF